MWDNSFNEDDPHNPKLADEYGMVMGTSHHEPMMRSHREWIGASRTRQRRMELHHQQRRPAKFLREGIDPQQGLREHRDNGHARRKRHGHGPMPAALKQTWRCSRKSSPTSAQILAAQVNPDVTKVPQLWALYTEVQKYYDAGLKVPDDMTLLFTDDNVGNLRRLPTPQEAPLRRCRHLLPHGHERRSVLLQVAQQQSAAKNLGTDEPRAAIRRKPDMDRQCRRHQAPRSSHGVFHSPWMGSAIDRQGRFGQVSGEVGRTRLRRGTRR